MGLTAAFLLECLVAIGCQTLLRMGGCPLLLAASYSYVVKQYPFSGQPSQSEQGAAQSPTVAPTSATAVQQNKEDLAAQLRMATAAEAQVVLAIVSALLLGFTLWFTRKAAMAAADAAKATSKAAQETKRSVDVQIRLEQPLLFVRMASQVDPPDWQKIDMLVENYGKTPAIIIEWSAECRAIDNPPERLEYSGIVKSRGMVLRPNEQELSLPVVLKDGDAQAIADDQATAHLWGYFKYEDALGRTRVKGFAFRCDPHTTEDGFELPSSFGLLWTRAGGKRYNYEHSEADF